MPEAGPDRRGVRAADAGQPGRPRRAPGLPQADAAGRGRRGAAAGVGVLRPLRRRHHRAAPDREPRGALRGRAAGADPRGARRPAARLAGPAGRDRPAAGSPSSSRIHHLGVKALALHDDEMLRAGRAVVADGDQRRPDDAGRVPRSGTAWSATRATIDEFRQLAAVAAAQDLAVVNGGYTYDTRDHRAAAAAGPVDAQVERLEPTDLTTRFDTLDPAVELALRPFLAAAQRALDRLGCEVVLRAFDPAALPALYLVDRSARVPRRAARPPGSGSTTLWAGVLDAFAAAGAAGPARSWCSTTATRWSAGSPRWPTPSWSALAVEALYGQALLLGHHPIRPADAALLNRSFLGLLDRAVPGRGDAAMRPQRASCGSCSARRWDMPYGAGARSPLVEQVDRGTPTRSATARAALRRADARPPRPTPTAASRPSRSSRSPGAWPSYDARPGAATTGDDEHCCCWHFKYMVVVADRSSPRSRWTRTLRGARRHGAPLPRRRAQPARRLQAPLRWSPGTSATPTRPTQLVRAVVRRAARRALRLRRLRPDRRRSCTWPSRGRDEEAVALAEPVLAGQLTCAEQPQSILTELLLPYLRTGRLDEAARRAPPGVPGACAATSPTWATSATTSSSARCTGNEARGLEIVERHLDWLDRAPSPVRRRWSSPPSAALVLRRLADGGHGDLPCTGGPGDRPPATWRSPSCADELADAGHRRWRRGSTPATAPTHQSERIARAAGRRADRGAPAAVRRRRAGGPRRPRGPADRPRRRPGHGRPSRRSPPTPTPDELLDLAERYGRTDRSAAARAVLRALRRAVRRRPTSPPLLAARRADGAGQRPGRGARCRRGGAAPGGTAVDGYRAVGDELRAHVALGRLGVLLCLTERGRRRAAAGRPRAGDYVAGARHGRARGPGAHCPARDRAGARPGGRRRRCRRSSGPTHEAAEAGDPYLQRRHRAAPGALPGRR